MNFIPEICHDYSEWPYWYYCYFKKLLTNTCICVCAFVCYLLIDTHAKLPKYCLTNRTLILVNYGKILWAHNASWIIPLNYKLRTVVLLRFRKCGLPRGLTEREKLLLIASLLKEKSYCISDIESKEMRYLKFPSCGSSKSKMIQWSSAILTFGVARQEI